MEENNPKLWSEGYNAAASYFNEGNPYPSLSSQTAEIPTNEAVSAGNFFSGFYNDLMGFTKQRRDQMFQRQMQREQWEYDSPKEQMKRMVEAGINPNLAGAGIANGNQSAAAPAAAGGMPAGNPADLVNPLGIVGDIEAIKETSARSESLKAQAGKTTAESLQVERLADAEIMFKAGQFMKNLVDSGTEEIQAAKMALQIFGSPVAGALSAFRADDKSRMYVQELEKIDTEVKQVKERFEFEKSLWPHELSITEQKALESFWQTSLTKALSEIETRRSELRMQYEGDPDWDVIQQITYLRQKYGDDSPQVKAYYDSLIKLSFSYEKGNNIADSQHVFNDAFNKIIAEESGRADFALFKTQMVALERAMTVLYDSLGKGDLNPIISAIKAVVAAATTAGSTISASLPDGSPLNVVPKPDISGKEIHYDNP